MSTSPAFGRLAVAMVTPFHGDGSLDTEGAQALAAHLVDQGCDALVLSGTTGEAPTTTDQEKRSLIRSVVEAVGDRARVLSGAGSNDTAHAVELARQAEAAGAHGLLVVAPYYSRPPQEGVRRHFESVADATSLPVLLYDVPARTGVRLDRDTLRRLAEHPRVVGVKDCTGDLLHCARMIAETGLQYYSGNDDLNLPLAAVGGVGAISTVANAAPRESRAVLDAYARGETELAARLNAELLPLVEAMMGSHPGTVTAKALLAHQGLPSGPVRLPLTPADEELTDRLVTTLHASALCPA